MNLDKKTRYHEWTYKNAPRIENTYGSFVQFLNVVLCEGYNENVVVSIEPDLDGLAKVKLPRGHGYIFNQVITIQGAEQLYYNGDFRVIESRHDFIKIKVDNTLVPATGTIKIKTSSLGFTNVYSNVDKTVMCFKNASIKSPGVLKVIDELPPNGYSTSWTKNARVAFGQEVDDSGEFLNNDKAPFYKQYPDAEKTGNGVAGAGGIFGFAKWDYANNDDAYHRENYTPDGSFPRNWTVIGDDKTFYIVLGTTASSRTTIVGFGNYFSYNPEETSNLCLQARDGFLPANWTGEHGQYARGRNNFGMFTSTTGSFLMSNIYGDIKDIYRYFSQGLFVSNSNYDRPWLSADINTINPNSGYLTSGLSYIKDTEGYLRGYHRGLRMLYGNTRLSTGSLSSSGEIVVTVTDPLNSGNVSYLFSLKDWEEIE